MSLRRKEESSNGSLYVKFKAIGDKVEGVYAGCEDFPDSKFGPSCRHIFNTKEGVRIVTVKLNHQINNLLNGEVGKWVRLTYEKDKPTGKGNPMKWYAADIDDGYVATAEELTTPSFDDDADDEEDTYTAPAKPLPRAATPSAANKAIVNGFANNRK